MVWRLQNNQTLALARCKNSHDLALRFRPLPGVAEPFADEGLFLDGGIEAIYDDVRKPVGLQAFAPSVPARGPMFSARSRLRVAGETPAQPEGVAEEDIY